MWLLVVSDQSGVSDTIQHHSPISTLVSSEARHPAQLDILAICCQLVHFENELYHESNSLEPRKQIAVDNIVCVAGVLNALQCET